MAAIVDAFARLILDDGGFQADVVKSADRAGITAGQTLGQRISGGLRANLKPILAGAIVGGGLLAVRTLTKAGLELTDTLDTLQADTGATGDDWAAMQKVVRRENGRTTESLSAIADAVKSMRQDLGLAGTDIDKYADKFFNAGLATHTSAATIVKATDDIAGAYNVNIDTALGAIDRLIASQQKWGGDLQSRIAALPGFGKAVEALGGTLDDAIALENIAAQKGLNMADVQSALTQAVSKFKVPPDLKTILGAKPISAKTPVKTLNADLKDIEKELAKFATPNEMTAFLKEVAKGKTPLDKLRTAQQLYNDAVAKFTADPLQQYLDDLIQIPDKQQRLARAQELFGKRGAAVWLAIADAIGTSGGKLDDYNISQDQAGQKADEVAKKLDEGPGRSFDLLREKIGAFLADIGSDKTITGLASLGTIVGGFAPTLGPDLFRALKGSIAGIGKRLLPLLGVEMATAGAGAGVAAAAAEVAAETTGVVAGQAAVGAAAVPEAAAAGAAIGTAMGEGAAATAGGTGILARFGVAGVGGLVGKALVGGVVLYIAATLAEALRQPIEDAGAAAHEFLPDWLKAPGEWVRRQTGGPVDLSWPFGHRNEPNWDELITNPAKLINDLGFAITHIGQDVGDTKIELDKVPPTFDDWKRSLDGFRASIPGAKDDLTGLADVVTGTPGPGPAGTGGNRKLEFAPGVGGEIDATTGKLKDLRAAEDAAANGPIFNPNARLDTSQIIDLRNTTGSLADILGRIPAALGLWPGNFAAAVPVLAGVLGTLLGDAQSTSTGIGQAGTDAGRLFGAGVTGGAQAADRAVNGVAGGIDVAGVARNFGNVAWSFVRAFLAPFFTLPAAVDDIISNTAPLPTSGRNPRARATGGPAPAGQPLIVGDAGRPELFVPTVSGRIYSQVQPLSALPAGGDTYQVVLPASAARALESPADVMRSLRLFGEAGVLPKRRNPSFG